MKAHATHSPRTSPKLQHRGRAGGFSLVEVVIAVAITALGVVTLLGLLPHGLELSRKTSNELATTRIVQQLIGEVQSMDWSTLTTSSSPSNRFFDDQGIELTGGGDIDTRTSYVAQLIVSNPDVKLPQSAGAGGYVQQNLRRATVNVAAIPDTNFDFSAGKNFRSFTQLVAKMR